MNQESIPSLFNYPAMLKLAHKKCVLVGSGTVALRKLRTLGKTGAELIVVAPVFTTEFTEAAMLYHAQLICDTYRPEYIQNAFLVIAATDDFSVNRYISETAPCLCNNITEPELSNFTVPSSFSQGDITVTIATGGVPAFTRLLRQALETQLSPVYAEFLEFLQQIRQEVKTIPSSSQERTSFWRNTLNQNILNLLASNNLAGAKEQVTDAVTSFRTKSQNSTR